MSELRPDQINVPGVFVPAVHPETGEAIGAAELQAKLGELGYQGAIIELGELIPEELLPFDPEASSLGAATYDELVDFVTEWDGTQGLATKIWSRLSYVSVTRAVNNRFWEETVELRNERDAIEAEIESSTQEFYTKSDSEITQCYSEYEDAQRGRGQKMRAIDERLMTAYVSIINRDGDEEILSFALERILRELKEPEEAGKPFVFVRGDDEELTPLCEYEYVRGKHGRRKGVHLKNTVMDLDGAYLAFSSGEAFPNNPRSQKMPQLVIKFFNTKIKRKLRND